MHAATRLVDEVEPVSSSILSSYMVGFRYDPNRKPTMPNKPTIDRESYFSELHDRVVAKVMETLDNIDLPDDDDHAKAISIILLDMAALWASRTGKSNSDHFSDLAMAAFEEIELRSDPTPPKKNKNRLVN